MKKSLIAVVILCLVLLCACSQKPSKQAGTQGATPNPYGFSRDEAAKVSGKRLEQAVKDKENAKNPKSPEGSAKPTSTDDYIMPGIDLTPNPSLSPIMQTLTSGNYAEKLSEEELKETEKLALEYARTFSMVINKVEIAEDSDPLYSQNPLYNKGNIIVYTFTANGSQQSVAIGRTNTDSAWKVLQD